jgi:cyclopropane fatty-acyl-phospholipid synthase-like methyltransferase
MQVTVVGEDLKEGLYKQAGIQAGVPVICRTEAPTGVQRMVAASADACVLLGALHTIADLPAFFRAVARLLKPGGRYDLSTNKQSWIIDEYLSSWKRE